MKKSTQENRVLTYSGGEGITTSGTRRITRWRLQPMPTAREARPEAIKLRAPLDNSYHPLKQKSAGRGYPGRRFVLMAFAGSKPSVAPVWRQLCAGQIVRNAVLSDDGVP